MKNEIYNDGQSTVKELASFCRCPSTDEMGRCTMRSFRNRVFTSFSGSIAAVFTVAALLLAGSGPAPAQNEKRTVYKENDFHWQRTLKPRQTLEIVPPNPGHYPTLAT